MRNIMTQFDKSLLENFVRKAKKTGKRRRVKGYTRMFYSLPTEARRLQRWQNLESALHMVHSHIMKYGVDKKDRQKLQAAILMLDDLLPVRPGTMTGSITTKPITDVIGRVG